MPLARCIAPLALGLPIVACAASTHARPPAPPPGPPERAGLRTGAELPLRHVDARLDVDRLSVPGSGEGPPRNYRLHRIAVRDRQGAASPDTVEHAAFTFQRIEPADPPAPGRAQPPPR